MSVPPPAATPGIPAKPRRKRGLLIAGIIVGVVALIGGGLAITYATIAAEHTPEKQLEAFLQHLVDGEAELALDLVGGVPTGNPVLLGDEVYAAATNRISAFEILDGDSTGPKATVTASITQGDQEYEIDFALSRVKFDFVFEVWRVDGSALPSFEVAFSRPEGVGLTANGVDMGVTDAFEGQVPAFPGSYVFAASGTNDLMTVEPVTEAVAFDEAVNATLSLKLTEQGAAAANGAVNGFIDGCLSQQVMSPVGGCGFGITEDGTTYTNQHWTTPGRPTFTYGEWRSDTFTIGGWFVTPSGPMTLDWNADWSDGTATGSVSGYVIRGFVSIDDAGVATFDSEYE